ncbi:hypothetical protein [Streptomyces sp. NPDC101150]|uniref:hypothetical protein n=1 Tax=Streptomyces sp. NPDC101150 TaxID=3366114 RepID=UPI003817E8D7
MDKELERELVTGLARRAVTELAPDELPLFNATSAAYFAAPRQATRHRNADDMLGFGLEAAVTLITTGALAAATEVAKILMTQAAEAATTAARESSQSAVRRLMARVARRREPVTAEVAPISGEQLAHVRRVAYERVLAIGVPEDKANLVADAVVGGLNAEAGQ